MLLNSSGLLAIHEVRSVYIGRIGQVHIWFSRVIKQTSILDIVAKSHLLINNEKEVQASIPKDAFIVVDAEQ